jgi:tRNA(Leu) C34 or U34 (ribose-2'-O)-methylase TrmL
MSPFKKARDVQAVAPGVVMIDPRDPHNIGAAVRACSCFGVEQVWVTGSRAAEKIHAAKRIPREERMKGFSDVQIVLEERPFEHFKNVVPVAVELLDNAENLLTFEHPENAVYVFGPEDGSIPPVLRQLCHRRVFIPTRHCTNLGAAVYLLLYDRMMKDYQAGRVPALPIHQTLAETRGQGWPGDDIAFT